MKTIAATIALSVLVLGCGGGGSSSNNVYGVLQSNSIASVQGLGEGEMLFTGYSSIATLEANSPNHVPPTDTLEPLGFDGLYYEFTSVSVNVSGAVTGNLSFFSDSAGQNQVGTGTLTATLNGSTTTVQLNIDMTKGPLPVEGASTITLTSGNITEVSGQLVNQASNSTATFDYKVASGKYSLELEFQTFTLASTGQVSKSGNGITMAGSYISEPLGPSGSITENSDGSGSMSLNSNALGIVNASWTSSQTLTIKFPGGNITTVTGAGGAGLG